MSSNINVTSPSQYIMFCRQDYAKVKGAFDDSVVVVDDGI